MIVAIWLSYVAVESLHVSHFATLNLITGVMRNVLSDPIFERHTSPDCVCVFLKPRPAYIRRRGGRGDYEYIL